MSRFVHGGVRCSVCACAYCVVSEGGVVSCVPRFVSSRMAVLVTLGAKCI